MQQFCVVPQASDSRLEYYVIGKPLSDKMSLGQTQELRRPVHEGVALTKMLARTRCRR
jgi:hypothetical protein